MAAEADLTELRARQAELVTALAVETDPSRLGDLQDELERTARLIEQRKAEN